MARKKRGAMPKAMKLEAMSQQTKAPKVSTKVPQAAAKVKKTTPAKSTTIKPFHVSAGRVEHAPKPAKLSPVAATRTPKPPKPPKV